MRTLTHCIMMIAILPGGQIARQLAPLPGTCSGHIQHTPHIAVVTYSSGHIRQWSHTAVVTYCSGHIQHTPHIERAAAHLRNIGSNSGHIQHTPHIERAAAHLRNIGSNSQELGGAEIQ